MYMKSDLELGIGFDGSFEFSSIIGAFKHGTYKVAEMESPIELLRKQIQKANR